jgi:hypothetical protein
MHSGIAQCLKWSRLVWLSGLSGSYLPMPRNANLAFGLNVESAGPMLVIFIRISMGPQQGPGGEGGVKGVSGMWKLGIGLEVGLGSWMGGRKGLGVGSRAKNQ